MGVLLVLLARYKDSGVSLATLDRIEAERKNVFQVETFFSDLSCLSLSVFSSLMLGPSDGGVNKEAMSSVDVTH